MTSLIWFKRDLRLADHAALIHGLRQGAVVPVYIIEPELWAQPDASARQYGFMIECLRALQQDLRRRGGDLVIRVGAAVPILRDLCAATGAVRLISHEETGNAWTYARDRAVAAWARSAGVTWTEVPQCGVVRRLSGRDGWARARDRFVFDKPLAQPNSLPGVTLASDPVPTFRQLGLSDDAPERQVGGRSQALSLLGGFLTTRGQTYRRDMSSPLQGTWACSRLSPHIAFGTLSVREVVQACAARQADLRDAGAGWGGSLRSFQSRLAWRDHFVQKLEDEPALEFRALHRECEALRPRAPDAALLTAWATGTTGLPFADACMRSLIATGWLNFRMRSMLMSLASYHLHLDWRDSGLHLARMFTDYEPGIHWSQVQMQSGATGINTPRIYNPVKQGFDQDPTGAFTRRWLPELADVPDHHLQEPWRWEGARRLSYPAPVIDVSRAAQAARARLAAVRQSPGFRAEAARVVTKHASRKDPQRRFVNDRAAKTKPRDMRQLSLDL